MANKHHYDKPVPSNMTPQREGTPRNVGSPPPDAPIGSYSSPPRTQGAKGSYQPQPNARPGERGNAMKQGPGPDMNGPTRPTGTAMPERRGMKDGRGDGGVPGRVGQPVTTGGDAMSINRPSPTPGYRPPGKPERGGP